MEQSNYISRVLDVLESVEFECTQEEVVELFPDLTWDEVFWAIDELTRARQIRLTRNAECGRYHVQPVHVPARAKPCEHAGLVC